MCTNPTQVGLKLPPRLPLLVANGSETYNPSARGSLTARVALAEALSKRAPVAPNELLLTASTSEAYFYLLLALCEPGDSILVPRPGYPLFDQLAKLAGVTLEHYQIAYDGSWYLELSSLPCQETIARKKIRAIMVVSPNNPTGQILSRAEFTALKSTGLPLIFDEVFRPFSLKKDIDSAAEPLKSETSYPLTIIVDGLSKRSCAPGLKLGWILARGKFAHQLLERIDWVSDTFLSVGGPIQDALPEILKQEPKTEEIVNQRLKDNRQLLELHLQKSAMSVLSCAGGWQAILRLPSYRNEEKWWELMAKAGVWLHPGSLYSLPLPCCYVISLLTRKEELREGLLRLINIVANDP